MNEKSRRFIYSFTQEELDHTNYEPRYVTSLGQEVNMVEVLINYIKILRSIDAEKIARKHGVE